MKSTPHRLLLAILAVFATLGALYAIYTPPWQVPDEPAHYNYVRALVTEGTPPVIEAGDYDQAYLSQLTDQQFPPELSIEPVTYEDHQPPLYYMLAAPVYLLFNGILLPMRLFSVFLGGMILLITYGLIYTLLPDRPFLSLTAAGLVAFLPQHLAMTAGVNNDPLAEVILGLALWTCVRYVTGGTQDRAFFLRWGLILGLAMLTKTPAFVALPISLLAFGLRIWRQRKETAPQTSSSPFWRQSLKNGGWILLITLPLGIPWLVRNGLLYGWNDPLGLARHNAVVVGQPRTAEWLAQYGWGGLLSRFARTTFQSFWGQFGWMGVPLHPSIYLALLVLSFLLLAGFLGWLLDRKRPRLTTQQRDGVLLLAASALLTLSSYIWYNLTFVQHQGRYLFPALIPLTLGAALGLDWLLSLRIIRRAAIGLAGLGLLLILWGVIRSDLPLVPIGTAFGLALLWGLAAYVPQRWAKWLAVGGIILGLVILDFHALFGAIVPMLTR